MISIVTLTYNNYEELVKTVESLKSISIPYEHIIVNGGTCNRTKDFLSELKAISVSEKDQGISDAFNKGWRLSRGSGIMYVNSGDLLIDPSYISYATEKIYSYDYIYADILYQDSLCGPLRIRPSNLPLGSGIPYPHNGLVIRRSVFDQLNGFDLNYKVTMDYDFLCRMRSLALKGLYYPNLVVEMDGLGVSSKNQDISLLESKSILIKNNLWNGIHKYYYYKRFVFHNLKNILSNLNLNFFIKFYKTKKQSLL